MNSVIIFPKNATARNQVLNFGLGFHHWLVWLNLSLIVFSWYSYDYYAQIVFSQDQLRLMKTPFRVYFTLELNDYPLYPGFKV